MSSLALLSIGFVSLLVGLALAQQTTLTPVGTPLPPPQGPFINISATPFEASQPVSKAFISYSIESSSFPYFTGNVTSPNAFSLTLLENIGNLTGTKPYIRVGGKPQDLAVYDGSQTAAMIETVDPATLSIGPSYFDSFKTWPDTKFIYGFNLAKSTTNKAQKQLLASVPKACQALGQSKLLYWELGNEPDLYKTSGARSSTWNEAKYAREWRTLASDIQNAMLEACPELARDRLYQFIAPSFAGTTNSLDPVKVFQKGLNDDKDISEISMHHTVDTTASNHPAIISSFSKLLPLKSQLLSQNLPFTLVSSFASATNSDTFASALLTLDATLYAASQNITRLHQHLSTDHPSSLWQPLTTSLSPKGTRAPYYAHIAAASTLGNLTPGNVQIAHIASKTLNDTDAAYAVYSAGKLVRIMVINLLDYSPSSNSSSPAPARPKTRYNLALPKSCAGIGIVNRLTASGSQAVTGVTWNGMSFNWEIEGGKGKILGNTTRNEWIAVGSNGVVFLDVVASGAALVKVNC
ncbi:glycoside hydrolase family 79 protein [Aulographum hederae CBS 113979]|uniref:Glycoside hydrolase family 79 protein n=1 Tax=Aulographum hederae CBS 113979 TaxID=1176131 RepID=A0A6G1GUS6_9PEZI|nr:glycoside hydrolase family 79 protein [Aulographum hederae CBS 113979]